VLRLRRNLAISPLFQVMMVLQNVDNGTPDERIQRYPLDIGVSKFDLVLEFTETQEGLAGFIEYSTALYKPQTIARMIGHLEGLCRAIALTPGARVRDLDYLSEAEKLNLLVDFNANCADYPKDKCIHHLFVEQVALNPDKIAVVFGEQSLSYQGLYYRSHDLALFLQSQGVGPDSLVGLCMERSLEMVVCLFGILQAGGAYAPLDPDYPDERLAYMAQDSQAAIILTQEKLRDKLSAVIPAGTPLITVDRQWPEIGARVADLKARGAQLDDGVTSHHLAYVIYTSGSTGKPKGVLVEHQSLVNHATAAAEEYTITRDDRVLQFFTLSFDAAAEEIFTALTSGATLALRPDDLLDTIEFMLDRVAALGITVLDLPTAVWHSVVAALGQPDKRLPGSLRVLCIGGEAALPQRVSEWRERVGEGVLLLNTYGPTEATIVATVSNLTVAKPEEEFGWEVSIGKPLANDKVYVLDPAGRTAPVGVPGELYIGGRGVTRGYLGRPQLTAERFLPDPFGPPGARMYRSGDLARFRADGELEFRGRADNQVKVRGYRIELGEIESRLNQHPEIENSVVIARGQEANKQLIAFYQAADAQTERVVTLSYEELRAHLAQTLPEYMAPAAFVSLAAIPLNPNGKVDRRALARMDVTAASGREYLAPRNDTEKQLVLIWAHVLNLAPEKIGVNDNFFELGGHSLLAMQLIAKTNRRFNRMAPVAVLFTAPTIAAFAKLISNEEAPSFDILVPIQANGDAPPIFAVPGAGGNALSLRPLGNALGPKQPLFALQAVGLDGKRPPLGSVEQTAQANVAALKTAQPEGPYSLIGHSYGGVVAYEMARILLERGEGITSLILLDSIAPAVMQSNFTNDEVAELVEACMSVADIYGARPEVDVERLRQLSDEEKVHHLAGLLSGLGLEMEREHLAAFYRVYQSNLLCYGAYKPAPLSYEVDVSLYRATQGRPDRPNLPPDYGWGRLLQRPIRIYDVEADHFSILKKARVIQGGGV
jgi:aspartate racemase